MKHIIPKEKKKVEINYPGLEFSSRKVPIIYIRYWNEEVVYVGETDDFYKGRHLRFKCRDTYGGITSTKEERDQQEKWDKTNFVRVLNAPKNTKHRRKWEAKLVCWLNPKLQKVNQYLKKANLDYNVEKNLYIFKKINDKKAERRITNNLESFLRSIKKFKENKNVSKNNYFSKQHKESVLHNFKTLERQKISYHNFKEFLMTKEGEFFPLNKQSLDLIDHVYTIANKRMNRIFNEKK